MTIALFKRRVYRFDENLFTHVLAECLENKTLHGAQLNPFTINTIDRFLKNVKEGKKEVVNYKEIAHSEDIDLKKELALRESYEKTNYQYFSDPSMAIHIIGTPRSGTSFVFNLLAHQDSF